MLPYMKSLIKKIFNKIDVNYREDPISKKNSFYVQATKKRIFERGTSSREIKSYDQPDSHIEGKKLKKNNQENKNNALSTKQIFFCIKI